MSSRDASFDTVRHIGLALPEVEESTAYGMPALKLHGDILATLPANRSAEPNSLMVRIALEDRAELLISDPATYYVPDHYESYDGVLVRLSHVDLEALEGLLKMARRYISGKHKTASARKKR